MRDVPDVPVIVSQHLALRCNPSNQWWFRRWFGFGPERFVYRRVERVTEVFDLPPHKVLALPNPRHAQSASFEITAEQEPMFEKPALLAVGRLTPQKDYAMLLRAFADLSSRRDLNLVILGDGSERALLEAQAQALGLSQRVFFAGFVDNDVRDVFSQRRPTHGVDRGVRGGHCDSLDRLSLRSERAARRWTAGTIDAGRRCRELRCGDRGGARRSRCGSRSAPCPTG
ncbi:MAG: glycosyltransferase [Deltaproteobacteria bacterium]|nr:glycosyltransferase [Deltaproteobacteria bacterium]